MRKVISKINFRYVKSVTRKERSTDSRIAEYRKYRQQCWARIRPSLVLSAILTVMFVYVILELPGGWKVGVPVLAFACLYTFMEIVGYYKHDHAIKKLESSK